jgi:hypothetical protein
MTGFSPWKPELQGDGTPQWCPQQGERRQGRHHHCHRKWRLTPGKTTPHNPFILDTTTERSLAHPEAPPRCRQQEPGDPQPHHRSGVGPAPLPRTRRGATSRRRRHPHAGLPGPTRILLQGMDPAGPGVPAAAAGAKASTRTTGTGSHHPAPQDDRRRRQKLAAAAVNGVPHQPRPSPAPETSVAAPATHRRAPPPRNLRIRPGRRRIWRPTPPPPPRTPTRRPTAPATSSASEPADASREAAGRRAAIGSRHSRETDELPGEESLAAAVLGVRAESRRSPLRRRRVK